MMELALLRTMLNKEFYDNNKGIRCPDKIFTKDVRKIKQALDNAMEVYDHDLSVQELEALFYTTNKSMTTATKTAYGDLFRKMEKSQPINEEIAAEVRKSWRARDVHVETLVRQQLEARQRQSELPLLIITSVMATSSAVLLSIVLYRLMQ